MRHEHTESEFAENTSFHHLVREFLPPQAIQQLDFALLCGHLAALSRAAEGEKRFISLRSPSVPIISVLLLLWLVHQLAELIDAPAVPHVSVFILGATRVLATGTIIVDIGTAREAQRVPAAVPSGCRNQQSLRQACTVPPINTQSETQHSQEGTISDAFTSITNDLGCQHLCRACYSLVGLNVNIGCTYQPSFQSYLTLIIVA